MAFIGKLLAGLVSVLRECRPQEAQYAVSAVGCVAQVLGEGFVPFYGGFMPLAQGILATQNGKEHRQLRANTMEAIALVGIAVGAEKFAKDGVALMDAVLAMRLEKGTKALMLEAAKALTADQALTAYAMASELMRSDGPYETDERRHLDHLALILSIAKPESDRIDSVFDVLHNRLALRSELQPA